MIKNNTKIRMHALHCVLRTVLGTKKLKRGLQMIKNNTKIGMHALRRVLRTVLGTVLGTKRTNAGSAAPILQSAVPPVIHIRHTYKACM